MLCSKHEDDFDKALNIFDVSLTLMNIVRQEDAEGLYIDGSLSISNMRCFVGEVMAMAKRFNKFQIHSLKLAFEESEHLTKDKKMDLVKLTGLDMEQITSWFNRKRARKRAKESVLKLQRINAELKQLLQQRHRWEAELQLELEESKRKEAELGDENVRLKRRLAFSASVPEFDPVVDFSHGYPL